MKLGAEGAFRPAVAVCCLAWLLLFAPGMWPAAAAEESLAERRQRLERMTPEEKNELLRKKRRFESLSPEEQARLRALHEQISRDPNEAALRQTLQRYNEWLKTLAPDQRAELQGLAPQERIARIRELKRSQEQRNFRMFSNLELPPQDMAKIIMWANNFVLQHQEEILKTLPPQAQRMARNMDPQRRRWLLLGALSRHGPEQFSLKLDQKELQMLLQRLSPEAREILARDPQVQEKIVHWLTQLGLARRMPPVSDEELQRFFREQLNDQQRRDLDRLPVDERRAELRRMYLIHRFGQRRPRDGRVPPRKGSPFRWRPDGRGGPPRPPEGRSLPAAPPGQQQAGDERGQRQP